MGCLFACFSTSKHKKRRFLVKANSSLQARHEAERCRLLQATKAAKNQEHPVKPGGKRGVRVKSSSQRKDSFDLVPETPEKLPIKVISDVLTEQDGEKEDEKYNEEQKCTRFAPESSHRCQSCSRTVDNFKDLSLKELNEADNTDGGKEISFAIEESSESLFSLSIESRKPASEVEFGGEKEVSSPITTQEIILPTTETNVIQNSNQNAQDQATEFVLCPIQSIADWKTAEVKKEKPSEDQEKENVHIGGEAETLGQALILNLLRKKKSVDQEVAVETSLSSWLAESERTWPLSKSNSVNSAGISDSKIRNSPSGYVDGSVLKELNEKEQKEEDVSCPCPKSSTRDQSSDNFPPTGTIGSYWSPIKPRIGF